MNAMDLERVLEDLKLILNGLLKTSAGLWAPIREATAAMPAWAMAAGGAGALALVVVLLLGRRRLATDRVARADPAVRPQPAPAARPEAAAGSEADTLVLETLAADAPEVQGLAELLDAQEPGAPGRDGRLKSFAGELDDLRRRLSLVEAGSAATARLLHEAREAIASGDLQAGTTLLVRAAEEEDIAGNGLVRTATVHGRASALSRLVAADLLAAKGERDAAAALYRKAVDATPEEDPELKAECLCRLGALAHGAGDAAAARDAFYAALAALEDAGATDHPDLGGILNNLGLANDLLGDEDAAERCYQRALAADEAAHGDNHPNVAAVLNNLGLLYRRRGMAPAAEPLLRRAQAIKEAHLAPDDPGLKVTLANRAAALRALGKDAEAAALERRAGVAVPNAADTDMPATVH